MLERRTRARRRCLHAFFGHPPTRIWAGAHSRRAHVALYQGNPFWAGAQNFWAAAQYLWATAQNKLSG